jgi:GntR family transcriptional regulator
MATKDSVNASGGRLAGSSHIEGRARRTIWRLSGGPHRPELRSSKHAPLFDKDAISGEDACLMSDNLPQVVSRPPLASQAVAILVADIKRGRWRVGERIPGETSLAAGLGISRPTLREAIRQLVANGLLEPRHGVGTFVARVPAPHIERGIEELYSSHELIQQTGYAPATGRCSVTLEGASAEVATELGLKVGARICQVWRLRLADGAPVISSDDFFDARIASELGLDGEQVANEVSTMGSIYRWFEERVGKPVDQALTHIEPVVATAREAGLLDVKAGEPLLRLRQTHYGKDGTPILYSVNVHRSDLVRFHVVRKRNWKPVEGPHADTNRRKRRVEEVIGTR